jgi:beta-N-acetylhexosaminidase
MRRLVVGIAWVGLLGCAATRPPVTAPPGPPRLDRQGEEWARKTLGRLTLEEKVGQLFMIWVRSEFMNVESPVYLELRDNLHRYHVGGLALSVPVEAPLLVRSRPEEAALLLNRLQGESDLPLLVAADFEAGVATRLSGATGFPQAMAFGAGGWTEAARSAGRITAREARAVGVHWNFFPVADVNSNPANPVINTRSFGENPQAVSAFVAATIEGERAGGVLTTVKHFPGHGDTATDSHYGVARVGGDLARLESVELPPFRRAIAEGVDSVMIAHVTVPAIEASSDKVASTSSAVVTDLLRNKLGFTGIVVTDALDMAALTRRYAPDVGRAAVDAFLAGNDVLLIPADLDASWRAMVAAVRSGEIPTARLDASVLKILSKKAALGLHRSRFVDVGAVPRLVGRPEDAAAAQAIADEAVTLVRNDGLALPLEATPAPEGGLPYLTTIETRNRLVVVVVSGNVRGEAGRVLDREVRARAPDAHVFFVDRDSAAGASAEVLAAADEAQAVVVAAFVAPAPGVSGPDAGEDEAGRLLQQLLARASGKTAVLAVGSPYVAQGFAGIGTYLCTLSSAAVSERSAVRALFGEIPITGRLPVTIPGVAERGFGIVHGEDERTPPMAPPGQAGGKR